MSDSSGTRLYHKDLPVRLGQGPAQLVHSTKTRIYMFNLFLRNTRNTYLRSFARLHPVALEFPTTSHA